MSWLGDVVKFENFNLGNQWDKLKQNPERAFTGAMDEGSTKVWNKAFDWTAPITGIHKNYEPMTDYFGGASKDSYTKAQDAGINTGPGASMHNLAKAVTAYYAGGYGANQLGAGSSAGGTTGGSVGGSTGGTVGGETINPATGVPWSETGSGFAGNGGYGVTPDAANGYTLSPSSSNPADYTDPYAAQDVMQQARDTSAASGSPEAWNTGANNSGSIFNKQMLAQSLKGMGGNQKQQQQPLLQIVKSQPAFLQQTQALPIQDSSYANNNPYIRFNDNENNKLALALRNS